MKRRNFLNIAATYTGGMMVVPQFLTASPYILGENENDNILVFIQLNGGNDGLNTYIPCDNPLYYQLRPKIGIAKNNVVDINNGMGWHPSLHSFAKIQQEGQLSILQNVGYPNPNRSHFRSQEIWQTASESDKYLTKGWLGRFLDIQCDDNIVGSVNFDKTDNLSLKGSEINSITLKNPDRLKIENNELSTLHLSDNPQLDFARKIVYSSAEGMDDIRKAIKKASEPKITYSKSELAENLKWVRKMISGNLPTKVYYTSLNGFDTHNNQLNSHAKQLTLLNDAVYSFYEDLKNNNILDRVTLVVFSEFGRRVADNGSGTDHGAAGPIVIVGGKNKGKVFGKNPDLGKLVNGDLQYEIDFRSVYATLLQKKYSFDTTLLGLHQSPIKDLF